MTIIPLFDDVFKQLDSSEHRKCPNGITNRYAPQKNPPVSQRETIVLALATECQSIKGIFKVRKYQERSKKSPLLDNFGAK